MSTTTKTGISLIIVLAVIVIGWFAMNGSNVPENKQVAEQKQEQTIAPTPTPKLPNTAERANDEERLTLALNKHRDLTAKLAQFTASS
jgi:hypothetical protein